MEINLKRRKARKSSMTDITDPYADDVEAVAPPKKGKRGDLHALMPEQPCEGDDLDRVLAFQPGNDLGNGTRLIHRFGADLIYVENIGWFIWDGARWDRERGQTGAVKLGHKVAQAISQEAKALMDKPPPKGGDERAGRLFAWSIQSGNQARIHGMLSAAAPYLTQHVDALDSDPRVLACPNGTIRLGNNTEFGPSRREDLLTRSLGVKFNNRAQCPNFERFLREIMPDEDMRDFLQRILGYCLTGLTREQTFFIFYGTGSNGKSTLMNVVRRIMGDYAVNSPVSTFLAKRDGNSGSEASPDLARLPGARMVSAAEPPEGARLDEAKVKEMASGEPMTVRHLNQGFFEFRPVFKAIISTNHQPNIRGTDHGIWRRIRLVPFTVQIPPDKVDRGLEAKLLAEAEGILQWMLTGAEDWFAGGLRPPAKAIAAVEDYRADQDPVGEFLSARCHKYQLDTLNPSTGRPFETSQKDLRAAYLEWCKDEGLDPLPAKSFGSKLTGRGILRRKSNGATFYLCIVLKIGSGEAE
jgi:putative DNA primase/helicase